MKLHVITISFTIVQLIETNVTYVAEKASLRETK
jgi:hypothetical protein